MIADIELSLTWPVIIAGCEVGGKWRDTVPRIFDDFRCDTAGTVSSSLFVLNSATEKTAASILIQQNKSLTRSGNVLTKGSQGTIGNLFSRIKISMFSYANLNVAYVCKYSALQDAGPLCLSSLCIVFRLYASGVLYLLSNAWVMSFVLNSSRMSVS